EENVSFLHSNALQLPRLRVVNIYQPGDIEPGGIDILTADQRNVTATIRVLTTAGSGPATDLATGITKSHITPLTRHTPTPSSSSESPSPAASPPRTAPRAPRPAAPSSPRTARRPPRPLPPRHTARASAHT